jgi:hypothetical protein
MLALTSPTSGGRSVGIVRSRTKATELVIQQYSVIWSKRTEVGEIFLLACYWGEEALPPVVGSPTLRAQQFGKNGKGFSRIVVHDYRKCINKAQTFPVSWHPPIHGTILWILDYSGFSRFLSPLDSWFLILLDFRSFWILNMTAASNVFTNKPEQIIVI